MTDESASNGKGVLIQRIARKSRKINPGQSFSPNNNSVRIILTADTHLGFDYPLRPRVNKPRRGEAFFRNFQTVLAYARQTGADLVVHGGDLFFRRKIPRKLVNLVYEQLLAFASSGIPLVLVPGNHERSQLPESLFLGAKTIFLFDRPKTVHLTVRGLKVALAGFPCVRNGIADRFSTQLQQTGWKADSECLNLLCLHQIVEGARVGPNGYTFRTGADVIPLRLIPPDFQAVLAGHIHRRQVLWRDDPSGHRRVPIFYPGSVERTSFAERNEPKGFYDISFGQSPTMAWQLLNYRFISLPTRPMREILLPKEIHNGSLRSYLENQVSQLPPDAIVRIRPASCHGNDVHELDFDLFRSLIPETMILSFPLSDWRSKAELNPEKRRRLT